MTSRSSLSSSALLSTSSTSGSSSASFSSPSSSATSSSAVPITTLPAGPPNNGGGNTGNGGNQNNGVIATSASLYLYTFLATLVLLLSVSAAIVIRSFILRRRHRLMVEEAIRNGTWVPPAPPLRPVKVDLSKKPKLWEAYVDKKGDLVGYAAGGGGGYVEVGIGPNGHGKAINEAWRTEQAREWDLIRPFAAAYLPPTTTTAGGDVPGVASRSQTSGTTTPVRLATIPSVGSLRVAAANNSEPTSAPLTPTGTTTPAVTTQIQQRPDESQSLPSSDDPGLPVPVTSPTPPASTRQRTPRYRRFLSSVGQILNPTPAPSSPLPAPLNRSNAGSTANLGMNGNGGEGIAMEELNSIKGPKMLRVAVLIAMPSPPVVDPNSSGNGKSTHVHSQSTSSGMSGSTLAHPPLPTTTTMATNSVIKQSPTLDSDEDEPLPHIEVGVADVLLVPAASEMSSPGEGAGNTDGLGKNRESVWSGVSEGSDSAV